MFNKKIIFAAFGVILFSSARADDIPAFGALKGNLSVTSGGVANYSIPLSLPNSRGSFIPSLAIEYSSQVENGELGVGFHVTGGSVIARCPQTTAQDGEAGRISYDDQGDVGTANGITDRFCLDGARLVLVSGSYGFDGSEYRTEIDSQRRIRFHRPASPDLPYFVVEAKDGTTATYGGSDNSLRVTSELPVPKVAMWLLRRVEDRSHNYYEYSYTGAASPGAEQLVSKISYGANATAGSDFDYEINFSYEARPDQTKKYQNSIKYLGNSRLQQVSVTRLSDPNLPILEKYKLAYEQGATSNRSRLQSVTQCNKQKLSSDFDCAKPVLFSWTDNQPTSSAWAADNLKSLPVQLFYTGSDGSQRPKYIRFVDLNGDGKNDILWSTLQLVVGSTPTVSRGAYLNTPNGWVISPEYYLPATDPRGGAPATTTSKGGYYSELGSELVDINGDGLVDFIYRYVTPDGSLAAFGAYVQVPSSNGSTSSRWQYEARYEPPTNLFFSAGDAGFTPPRFVDVNGDGLVDLLYRAAGYTGGYGPMNGSYARINTPSSSATGSSAFWVEDSSYTLPMPMYFNKTATISANSPAAPGDISTRFVDLNGDGLMDFIYYRAVNGTVQKRAYINNQYGAADSAGWACDPANDNSYTASGGSKWVCNDAYMPPTPMYRDDDRPYSIVNSYFPLNDLGVRFVDLNNDGLQDLIYSRESQYDDNGNARSSPPVNISGAFLNTGSGWVAADEYMLPDAPAGAHFPGQLLLTADKVAYFGRYFVDVNGDNLVDFIYNWKDKNGTTVEDLDAGAYLNNGGGNLTSAAWTRVDKYAPPCPLYGQYYQYWGGRVDDINGDGVADIACNRPDIPGASATYISNPRVDLLKDITDGLGANTQLYFKPITDASVYSASAIRSFPNIELTRPVYVVSSLVKSTEAGDGSVVTTNYTYTGLKSNLQGRGAIGFESVTEETTYPATAGSLDTSSHSDITETHYSQEFPYYGFVVLQKKSIRTGFTSPVLVHQAVSDPATDFGEKVPFSGVYLPYIKKVSETSYDPLSGMLLSSRLKTEEIDEYANRLSHSEVVTEAGSSTTYTSDVSYAYLVPDISNWQIGRIDREVKTYSRTGVPNIVRTRKLTYFPNGLLNEEIREPDLPLYKLVTAFTYDDYGNIKTRSTSGAGDAAVPRSGITARTESFVYLAGTDYSANIFPSSTTNSKLQTTYFTYDPVTGRKLTVIDPNNVETEFGRDSFGLELTETKITGAASPRIMNSNQYDFCETLADCVGDEAYRIIQTPAGKTAINVYYDRLGRETRRVSTTFNLDPTKRQNVYTAVAYDARGQLVCQSRPILGTAPAQKCVGALGTNQWTLYRYDGVGRQILKREPSSMGMPADTTTNYAGFATIVTNPLGNERTEQHNALSELISVTDAAAKTVSFTHDAAGAILDVTDPLGNVTSYTYDLLGRKTSMSDPDLRSQNATPNSPGWDWKYQYDVANELILQTDAKGQSTKFYYDELGRLVQREESDLITTWAFDTAAHGVGKLASATAANNYGYQKTMSYDVWGRLVQTTTQVDGVNYDLATAYDDADRVVSVTYPTGFTYENIYDNGFLAKVQDATPGISSHTVFWAADSRDAAGHVTHETLGNNLKTKRTYIPETGRISTIQTGTESGSVLQANVQNDIYSFDDVGNLTLRLQAVAGSSFWETFEYDELNRISKIYPSNGTPLLVLYDALGNISFRSDLGTYSYSGCGGTHRVCSVLAPLNVTSISYDANGNMITGNGRSYTWNSFNKPSTITQGTTTETLLYGDEHQRVRRVSVENGQQTVITYLNPRIDLGQTYEKVEKADGTVEHTQYIYADGHVIGAVVQTDASPTAPVVRYFHQDNIGSITAISDSNGQVEHLSYDVWGKRRDLNGSDDFTVTSVGTLADMATPVAGADKYGLIQKDPINNQLTLHTYNRLPTAPSAVGPTVSVADIMRLTAEVVTSADDFRQRRFITGIENTAIGTSNYRRYAAYIDKDAWYVQTCTGTAPCVNEPLGEEGIPSVLSATSYIVKITSTAQSAQLMVYEKSAPQNTVLQDIRQWDLSVAGVVSQKQPMVGLQLRGNFVPIGGIILPIERPDAASVVTALSWDRMTLALTAYNAVGTRRGFTLHEQMDSVNLVNMNGRFYDPLLGRFISADPNVFYPDNTQDYNRYSYVWNNPLSLTDPSGFAVDYCGADDIGALIGSSYGVSGGYGLLSSNFGQATGQQLNSLVAASMATTTELSGTRFNFNSQTIDAIPEKSWMNQQGYSLVDLVGSRLALFSGADESGLYVNPLTRTIMSPGEYQAAKEGLFVDVVGGYLGEKTVTAAVPRLFELGGRASSYLAKLLGRDGEAVAKSGAGFADEAKLLSHFEKHGAEFGVKSADEYLQVGRDIMQQGQKVQYLYKGETRTGYAQFMGNTSSGNARFGFVGTNADGAITTIHTQSGNSFWKLLNGNPADKTIRPIP